MKTTALTDPAPLASTEAKARQGSRQKLALLVRKLDQLGLGALGPYVRLAAGDEPRQQLASISQGILYPGLAVALFFGFWTLCAATVRTDSMAIPSPKETWQAWQGMREFARNEATKKAAHEAKMAQLSQTLHRQAEAAIAAGQMAQAETFAKRAEDTLLRRYAGPPTFGDQIFVSLVTVALGFGLAMVIAVPLGLLCGLNPKVNLALTPLIQIFKPVSPLAWLPIVFVFVTALYKPAEGAQLFGRALFVSAGTVTLCSLWPTLINTAFGAASVQQDYLNVAKVLRLGWMQRLWRIVIPSSLPFIFTGLRLSLGVGWMVLIAADMLAQNPGLGKFIWDTFQNGSADSMGRIVVAVFVIGFIGFILDRLMLILQNLVTTEARN